MFTLIDFYGKWDIEVLSTASPYDVRFEVRGGAGVTGGGVYPGAVGTVAHVNGPVWHISFEWSKPAAHMWNACEAKQLDAGCTPDKGITVTVGAHPDLPAGIGTPYDHLVVRLRSLDHQLNPFIPITNFPDFTYPRGRTPLRPRART